MITLNSNSICTLLPFSTTISYPRINLKKLSSYKYNNFRKRYHPNSINQKNSSTNTSVLNNDDLFSEYKPKTAFLFPGQGAQYVGMANDLVNELDSSKVLFDKASNILGYDLFDICVNGPKEKLDSTEISQPAIYVSSLAALEKLKLNNPNAISSCNVTCGLSLGEYTALSFAGAMSFEDGLRLVKLRGEAMQSAADKSESGMISVIGLTSEKVTELCKVATEAVGEENGVKIANYLCPGNYAISGGLKGCEYVEKHAKSDFKARMTVRLAVAGAFHTEYMKSAVEKLKKALDETNLVTPRIPVISNVDAMAHSDPEKIKQILSQQLTSPVQWEKTIKTLLEKGLENSYEIGPGKVIAGILKRIDKKHNIENINA